MLNVIFEKIKKNHALAMILCCAIPIVGILALSSLGILGSWGYIALILICPLGGSWGYIALILICPLGHVLMMRGMHSKSGETMVPRQIEHKSDES
jgi:hypothetical protein